MMIFQLTPEERDRVVEALSILAAEYRTVSEACISPILARSFERDATEISSLAGRAAGLVERPSTPELNAQVLQYLDAGERIPAIRYVRYVTGMGLKDSKDYVDKVEVASTRPLTME